MNVAQARVRIVVEIFAKDERCYERFQFRPAIAGEWPRLEPGIALPGSTLGNQVLLERAERRRERARVAIRAQSHVDAKYIAVGGDVGERRNHAAAEFVEELLIGERL